VGIAAQIFQRLLGTAKWRFGIYNPFAVFLGCQMRSKNDCILKRLDLAGEDKLAPIISVFHSFQKEPSEKARQHAYGQEEARFTANPSFIVRRESAAGNDAMNMRMMQKPPTVP
jgi:hypothetical protein